MIALRSSRNLAFRSSTAAPASHRLAFLSSLHRQQQQQAARIVFSRSAAAEPLREVVSRLNNFSIGVNHPEGDSSSSSSSSDEDCDLDPSLTIMATKGLIQRLDCGPRLSEATIHHGTVYLAGECLLRWSWELRVQEASMAGVVRCAVTL
jgi:hypothetical protein